mgnify:CR=1 FL=1|tara:strand:+ start:434 stop:1393 length:960 start_codon:yes stop_codon:yes gene_type:complete
MSYDYTINNSVKVRKRYTISNNLSYTLPTPSDAPKDGLLDNNGFISPPPLKEISYTNKFNKIKFIKNHTVYVESPIYYLENLFDKSSVEKIKIINPNIVKRSRNASCDKYNLMLKGIIDVITEVSFGKGNFKWHGTEIIRNMNNYPEGWPDEIFWLKFYNGENWGLERYNIGVYENDNVYYYDIDDDGNEINEIYLKDIIDYEHQNLYPVTREQITNLQTRLLVQSSNVKPKGMNTPRFRSTNVGCSSRSVCLNNTLTPGFKNSTKNPYLAPIPYGQRLGNTFRSAQIRGSKKIVRRNYVDPQFGRLVGTGGAGIKNKF